MGTGTGYNTALLAHRLGAGNVVTIEIDNDPAQTARNALKTTGYDAVTVVTGDGAQGYPPAKPFDRVLSTAAVQPRPLQLGGTDPPRRARDHPMGNQLLQR
ncbi:MAG: protein-L-isoaspartate O-methyltransferase family protein [Pseudonocardiaceae bacterium]